MWGAGGYLALCFVQGLGQHLGLYRQVLHLEGCHHALYLLAPEDAEQVVLQAQEVARAARVTLPAECANTPVAALNSDIHGVCPMPYAYHRSQTMPYALCHNRGNPCRTPHFLIASDDAGIPSHQTHPE